MNRLIRDKKGFWSIVGILFLLILSTEMLDANVFAKEPHLSSSAWQCSLAQGNPTNSMNTLLPTMAHNVGVSCSNSEVA